MRAISASTRQWVQEATGSVVIRSEALLGGMSSEIHHCWCSDGSDVVVRHIADTEWLEREPHLISNEALTLDLLLDSDIAAPRHLASNAERGFLLMSFLGGVVISQPDELRQLTPKLANLARQIGEVPLPTGHGIQKWRPWVDPAAQPPIWGDAGLWSEAMDAYRSERPPIFETGSLLHRDLHPLNLLWEGGEVVGVVDWVNASVGHSHADLGHCRWNLAVMVESEAAESFLRAYMATSSGESYDRYWDLVTVLSFLPGPIGTSGWEAVGRQDLTKARVLDATEQFLRSALA